MFHSITLRPAPAAASRLPSGLNATAYSGRRRFAGQERGAEGDGMAGPGHVPQPQCAVGGRHREHLVIGARG